MYGRRPGFEAFLLLAALLLCPNGCKTKPPKKKAIAKETRAGQQPRAKRTPEQKWQTYSTQAPQLDERLAQMAQDAARHYVIDFNRSAYETGLKLMAEKKYPAARHHFDEVIRLAIEKGVKTKPPVPDEEVQAEAALPRAVKVADYRIVAGDLLVVTVWGAPELSGEVKVTPDGKLSYPYVGEVHAAGMTFGQLASHMEGELKKRLAEKETAAQGEYRLQAGDVIGISVDGYPELARDMQVAPDGTISFPHVGELVAEGKTFRGLADLMSERLARVLRSPRVTIHAKRLVKAKQEKLSERIREPKVTIQARELAGSAVTVLGAVTHPGRYRVGNESRVLDALAEAGGLVKDFRGKDDAEAANLRNAYLVRSDKKVPVDFYNLVVEGDTSQNIPLLPGDVIYVPTTREKREETVTILGALRDPGRVRLVPEMRVLDVVAEAGGLFMGSIDQIQLQAGTFRLAFLSRGGVIMPVDFEKLVFQGDLSQNILVQAGDFIYVPTSEDNIVFVLGEVNFPRTVNFSTHMTFARAMASAGGMTLDGERGAVYLVRGDLKKKPQVTRVDAFAVFEGRKKDFDLQPYDIVYVSPTALTETSHVITQVIPGLQSALDVKILRHGP